MNSTTFISLCVLSVCHWVADFTHLSTDWMLNAKKYGKPLYPIFIHALVHALLFFIAVYFIYDLNNAVFAGVLQLTSHFFIDLFKGKLNYFFRRLEDPTNKFHWWVFGADQLLHHLIIFITVYYCSLS